MDKAAPYNTIGREADSRIERAPASNIRERLNADESAEADRQIRLVIDDRIRRSAIFRTGALDQIAELILVQPSVEGVLTAGDPASAAEKRRLGLGDTLTVGAAFTDTVADMRGTAAIRFVSDTFAQLRTRYRCIMLRVLGARDDNQTRRMAVRLYAADSSCVDSLNCDGEVYSLSELPVFPLPGCLTRECPCSLELIDDNGPAHRSGQRKGGLFGWIANRFGK